MAKIMNFINGNLAAARALSGAGKHITPEAMEAFAQAAHGLIDMGDPMHVSDSATVWTGEILDYPGHFFGEFREDVDWLRLGQSVRLFIAAVIDAFGDNDDVKKQGEDWAERTITEYVSHNFSFPSPTYGMMRNTEGANAGLRAAAEEAARQCALGNPAACH